MGITVVPSAVTGQTLSAAQWNTQVRDNINGIWVLTTAGDLLYATGASAAARLAIGAALQILGSTGSAPSWRTIADVVYPVGSIYTSISSTNPSTLFGGTWAAFGAGRTLVGRDAGQTEFDTVEETGGAKTHTLTVSEIPSHPHAINNFPVWSSNAGLGGSGYAIDGTETRSTEYYGGGGAHNNLQPYIVVYFWKRTA